MPQKPLLAPHTDPLYNQLKNDFLKRSDDFPVLMLPVRLETRFMNTTRFRNVTIPGQGKITALVSKLYKLAYDIKVWQAKQTVQTNVQQETKIETIKNDVNQSVVLLQGVPELTSQDRKIVFEAIVDVQTEVKKIKNFGTSKGKKALEEVKEDLKKMAIDVAARAKSSRSVYQKGYDYLNALQQIEDQIQNIYINRHVNSATIDAKLNVLDAQFVAIESLIKTPDFLATAGTIQKISSKISYIKRLQKNNNTRLQDFKIGYKGPRDLHAKEFALRAEINGLKTTIDDSHVPYMQLLANLKTHEVRGLRYQIEAAYYALKAHNTVGYKDYNDVMQAKLWLYKELKSIRTKAHTPLEGSVAEINALKSSYSQLKGQIVKFLTEASKQKPKDTYKKAALSRLHTHLQNEYLADLQELEPGFKTIELQSFSDSKIRETSASATKTRQYLTEIRDFVKSVEGNADQTLLAIRSKVADLNSRIKISATNTILIPRAEFVVLKGLTASIRDSLKNVVNAKRVPSNHPILAAINTSLAEINASVEDQHIDVFDERDKFYDTYRKRITFKIGSETVKELWVRIFPDDIHIDNHDERITDDEEKIGKTYYAEVYGKITSKRNEAKLPAWRAAAASLGARRAAYVIKKLTPAEVLADSLVEPKNEMATYLKDLQKFVLPKNLRLSKKIRVKKVNFADVAAFADTLARQLRLRLDATAFVICSENKKTLDDFVEGLQFLSDHITNTLLYSNAGANQIQLSRFLKQLRLGIAQISDFCNLNYKALSLPFIPVLTFPIVEKKSQSWDRAGVTDSLPDRFIVVTKRGGEDGYKQIVVGKPVHNPLYVSIDPSGDQADEFAHTENGDLQVPEKMRWMFDFDAAVEAGMAVRVPLQDEDFKLGFDFVMAFGVQDDSATAGQNAINKLLENHLYSDGGLELLPVGTATNNTEKVKSPYNAIDDDADALFDVFMPQTPATYLAQNDANELQISDGQFFKDALGLPNSIADFVRNREKTELVAGRAVNRALYNATLKYYLNVMVGNLFNKNDKDQTLTFMLRHVSAMGTVPTFRVDNQPYGVLPITNYRSFKHYGGTTKGTEGSYMKQLTIFLNATRQIFDSLLSKVTTVNSAKYQLDPQKEFLSILGLEPHTKEFFYRFGTNISSRWNDNDSLTFPINWNNVYGSFTPTNVAAHYDYLLKDLGHSTASTQKNAIQKSRAYINRYMHANFINGPIVQDAKVDSEKLAKINGFEGNYIDWLYANHSVSFLTNLKLENLPKVTIGGAAKVQNTLLLLMLRGSFIYDSSSWALRTLPILSQLNVEALERLVANHLDLCSYRLDAWLTGLANYRLRELRTSKPQGSYLGAYGFVHGLKPSIPLQRVQNLPEGLSPDNGEEVYRMPDNQGFIHGPSMNHAITAAVLRAGYNSLKNNGDNNNALSINLSSSRVRKALAMLEGVGNGQEAGALLGYMLERALHEGYVDAQKNPLEMDVYIYRLRRKFPTFGDMPKDADIDLTQNESIKAANVVDGLAMVDYFEAKIKSQSWYNSSNTFAENIIVTSGNNINFRGYPWGLNNEVPNPNVAPAGSTIEKEKLKLKAIIHELDHMADAFDALGDLLTSEGVYQLVRGNHVRAMAVLNAVSEGKIPLDPEIIRSMREGIMVTHRAILCVPQAQNQNAPWLGMPQSPRGLAEPAINNWLAAQIGNPNAIDWQATYEGTETYISLNDLKLQPIDLVLLVTAGGDDGLAELQMRCVDYLLENGASSDQNFVINFNESSHSTQLSFGEMVSTLQNLGKTILNSRPADARDFRIPEDEANFGTTALGINTAELKLRLKNAVQGYADFYNTLTPFTAEKLNYSATEKKLAITVLSQLSLWGFAGFYPTQEDKDDTTRAAAKILSAKAKITSNLAYANTAMAQLETELDQAKWQSACNEIATRLYGNGFKMVPIFSVSNESTLAAQLNLTQNEGILRNLPANYMADWLGATALVRQRLAPIETVGLLADVLFGQNLSVIPAQLPFDGSKPIEERDYWLGAEFPEQHVPDGDKLSLLFFGENTISVSQVALILDEWIEVIPDKNETTGIALHFNQPDARAPQSVLLAVPAERTGKWNLDDLAYTVEEAYNMARLRSIEPEHVDFSMLSQLLPATATLAFGNDEMARRMIVTKEEDKTDLSQKLGYFIDYTATNFGATKELLED